MVIKNPKPNGRISNNRSCPKLSIFLCLMGFGAVMVLSRLIYLDYTGKESRPLKLHLVSSKKYKDGNSALLKLQYAPRPPQPKYQHTTNKSFHKALVKSQRIATESTFLNTGLLKSINDAFEPPITEEFDCKKIFKGDKIEIKRADNFKKRYKYIPPTSSAVIQATLDCNAYKVARGYRMDASEEETQFPLAFSIVIHKSVEQFERLLRAVYRPVNFYCIHVDKKSKPTFHKAVQSITKCFPNVFIASKLEEVVYAGYTRLQADINCMRELYDSYTGWKYLLNMAGSEFPLMPNKHIVYLLKLMNGTNMVERHMETFNTWRHEKEFRTVVSNGSKPGHIASVSRTNSPPPYDLKVTKCSAYGAFSREFIGYVLTDPVPRALLEWSKTTYSPDEMYWGTLNNLHDNPQLLTPGGDFSDEDNHVSRAVMWKSHKCHGRNVHIICNYGSGDLPWLAGSYQMIANKFDLKIDQVAFRCIEELVAVRNKKERPKKIKQFLEFLRAAKGKQFR